MKFPDSRLIRRRMCLLLLLVARVASREQGSASERRRERETARGFGSLCVLRDLSVPSSLLQSCYDSLSLSLFLESERQRGRKREDALAPIVNAASTAAAAAVVCFPERGMRNGELSYDYFPLSSLQCPSCQLERLEEGCVAAAREAACLVLLQLGSCCREAKAKAATPLFTQSGKTQEE